MNVFRGFLILAATILWSPLPETTATAGSLDYNVKWTHYGIRPLAMGNAFVSVADDFNALFYNPAGLARLEEWDGEFLNPSMEISAETTTFIGDLMDLANGSASDSKAVLDLIEKNTGKNHHGALSWTPHLIFPHFGFGIGAELDLGLTFHRYPSAFLNAGPKVVIPFSFAMNFLEDRLSFGLSLKARVQGGIYHEFSIQDLEALKSSEGDNNSGPKLEDYVRGGYGMGADFGMLFTPMKPMEPTLGISISDLGGTSFEKMDIGGTALGAPDQVLPSVNIGMSFKPIQTSSSYLLAAIDMHSINQPFDYSKKLNLGVEWGYGTIIKIQSGLHQGYFSGGLQLDAGLLALRLASYAEEMGNVAGKSMDRRYIFQLKLLI